MRNNFALQAPAGHREFLLEIWSDRWRTKLPFERYAAWLTEQGDNSAASVVNKAAAQLFEGATSSLDPKYGEAWLGLLSYPWSSDFIGMDERNTALFREDIRPAVTMLPTPTSEGALEIGQSHLGGLPHLPSQFEWPQGPDFPLRFLAQINFADIADSLATSHFGLPTDGWLVVFASGREGILPGCAELNESGEYVDIPNLTALYYLPADSSLIRFEDGWDGYTDDPQFGALENEQRQAAVCALSFRDSFSLPDQEDGERSGDETTRNEYADYLHWDYFYTEESKLMGWANSLRSGGTCPGADWRNLISLRSDYEILHWSWCDDSILNIHVHVDGLDNRTFAPFDASSC